MEGRWQKDEQCVCACERERGRENRCGRQGLGERKRDRLRRGERRGWRREGEGRGERGGDMEAGKKDPTRSEHARMNE